MRKLALLLALATHLLAPTASATAGGFDPASMLCAPSGKVSAEAQAAIEEMLRFAGAEEDETPSSAASGHCGACVMVGCAMAAQPGLSLLVNPAAKQRITWTTTVHAVPSVHGPPLGLRAPPADLADEPSADCRPVGAASIEADGYDCLFLRIRNISVQPPLFPSKSRFAETSASS